MSEPADGELETAADMAASLSSRETGPVELVERAVARAEAWQPSTNAFSQLWSGRAVERAWAIDALVSSLPKRSSLSGIPLAVKDLFDMSGVETTGCCAAYRGRVAEQDSPMVERAERAGLVIVGKTNQHELAAGGTNLVSACGRTGNPWEPARMTGGSSGGSAAAVAAGIVPWALGSDTGGSIRIPASMCGTFGLKPTTGRLPIDGMLPLGPSLDCPGPIAATAQDLRALFDVIAAKDVAVADGPGGDEGPRYRIGLPDGFFADVHHETAAVVQETARVIEGYGMEIEPRDGHGIEGARSVWMDVCTPEFSDAHPLLRDPERRALVAPSVVKWLEHGERLTEEERAAARDRRGAIARWYRDRLEGLDALLIPTTAYPAPAPGATDVELAGSGMVSLARVGPGWITCSVNLAGLPAVNLPAGRSSEGLPIGVSLVGHPNSEGTLLHLAEVWQLATGYRPQWPRPPANP